MINIFLNQQTIQISDTDTLADVLNSNGFESGSYAVAVNRQFIPRAQHQATSLSNGDEIDIIVPMQGG